MICSLDLYVGIQTCFMCLVNLIDLVYHNRNPQSPPNGSVSHSMDPRNGLLSRYGHGEVTNVLIHVRKH